MLRRNHHVKVGQEFYTLAGRHGTVLAQGKGFYRVRWSDTGHFGTVADSRSEVFPVAKKKNPAGWQHTQSQEAVRRAIATRRPEDIMAARILQLRNEKVKPVSIPGGLRKNAERAEIAKKLQEKQHGKSATRRKK